MVATTLDSAHIEVEWANRSKRGQRIAGDAFLSRRIRGEDRVVSVLSDGLGSGVKASVLATLTATMAVEYASRLKDLRTSAETIMDTLPVCSVRKISYSTFTIADVSGEGEARVVEHGNPPFVLLRGAMAVEVPGEELALERWKDRDLRSANFRLEIGDRLVLVSDGVSQSGMGREEMPLGWGRDALVRFLEEAIEREPEISARRLSQRVVAMAHVNDRGQAKDDISCAVISYRKPRGLLVLTGPPFARERDAELGELVLSYPGRKAICGGTTARIVGRVLGREVFMDLESELDTDIPPASRMDGVDLITEGTLTLARAAELLERGEDEALPDNPAGELLELMLDSDVIEFVVGTRINEAHQDPNIPVELDLRRNVVKKLVALLEQKHLKKVGVRLV
ncbi:MAG: SpoIIE family protein phosphatase [Myxococcales bacterium]